MKLFFLRTIKIAIASFVLLISSNIFAQEPEDLMWDDPYFVSASHVVATSFFHWYGVNPDGVQTGQYQGPWVPIEGRENWTGDAEFFKRMVKQAMAANIDVLYVHLIPFMEQQRINLFQALFELRQEGYAVPKVAPFLDPIITYSSGGNTDLSTTAGKDFFADQYIRFFEQYYSQNTDDYADDFLYSIDDSVVLDTWHISENLTNYDLFTRFDLESRLEDALTLDHPIFYGGIHMVTTAISPTFNFTDERVHQFEVHEYYIEKSHNGIVSAQIKPGYWDQNIRPDGYLLERDGGSHYTTAWNNIGSTVKRIYIESFNEYDEGSGIFAAKPDVIFRTALNPTNTDTWSNTDDPYEYIKTTAIGAANFNDDAALDAKVLWDNIPNEMYPGDTYNVIVVMRNEGNTQWNDANNFKFGQQDSDSTIFGDNRFLIDDSQNEIPEYGGVFNGRPITFNIQLEAPTTEASYVNHYGMLQEGVAWIGEILERTITVTVTADRGTLGVDDFNLNNQFSLHPNPVSLDGQLQINGEFKKNDKITLLNILGSKIIEQEISRDQMNTTLSIQGSAITEGIYVLQIIRGSNIQTKKIIIQN